MIDNSVGGVIDKNAIDACVNDSQVRQYDIATVLNINTKIKECAQSRQYDVVQANHFNVACQIDFGTYGKSDMSI